METNQQITERLKASGYTTVTEYDDVAGEFFPDHTHPGEQRLVVVRGSIEVGMDGQHSVCGVGDEIVFPQMKIHSARVGSDGCLYIVGEKPPV